MQSSSRNGAKVIWLGVHTTEGIMRATALRDWTGWAGSSHAASDETGALLTPADGFVPYDRSAWTLRNGNAISENIEQCGWARWTRAEWLARPKLLDATARWLAERSVARGIPLVRLSAADIRARKPGVIGHGDYTVATDDGTHTDPGRNYPWDVVLNKARAYAAGQATPEEDFLSSTDAMMILQEIRASQKLLESVSDRPLSVEARLTPKIDALTEVVRQLAERQGTPIDMAAIEAVVERGVQDAIAGIETTVTVKSDA